MVIWVVLPFKPTPFRLPLKVNLGEFISTQEIAVHIKMDFFIVVIM